MEFKSNLNKLHYLLTENFENVEVREQSDKKIGNYLKISVKENLQCDIIVTKKDLEMTQIKWKYNSNPLNESNWVERDCNLNDFPNVIKDIFDNKRFDKEYLKNIN